MSWLVYLQTRSIHDYSVSIRPHFCIPRKSSPLQLRLLIVLLTLHLILLTSLFLHFKREQKEGNHLSPLFCFGKLVIPSDVKNWVYKRERRKRVKTKKMPFDFFLSPLFFLLCFVSKNLLKLFTTFYEAINHFHFFLLVSFHQWKKTLFLWRRLKVS